MSGRGEGRIGARCPPARESAPREPCPAGADPGEGADSVSVGRLVPGVDR